MYIESNKKFKKEVGIDYKIQNIIMYELTRVIYKLISTYGLIYT